MYTLVIVVHVIVSIALILIILLQTGKGSDIGAVFGGGSSQTLFGSTGPTSFLSKLTAGAAIIFMFTSLFLAYFAGGRSSPTLMKGGSAPATAPGPASPQGLPPGMPPGPGGATPAPAAPPSAPAPAQPGK
ncbi:MAG: preprotein translocase subunit SecG [Deltaproteobacteria bacterium]|nr:MAG: preprotein translocase subunit SecG [Deltaproteobacteria bacterium]